MRSARHAYDSFTRLSDPLNVPPGGAPSRRRFTPALGPRSRLGRLLNEPAFTWVTVALDLVMAGCAVVLTMAWAKRDSLNLNRVEELWLFPVLVLACFWFKGLYHRRLRVVFLEDLAALLGPTSLAAMLMLILFLLIGHNPQPGSVEARLWLVAVVMLGLGRLLRAFIQGRARLRPEHRAPALIVGAGLIGHHVARRLNEQPQYGLRVVGFLDADPPRFAVGQVSTPLLGTTDDLLRVAEETHAEQIIIAFSSESDRQLLRVARAGHSRGLRVSVVPRLFDATNQRMELEHLGGLPLLGLHEINPRGWQFALKYGTDRVGAFVGVVLLSPLLAVLALAVRVSSPGPILYRQRRVGRDGQLFDLLKFRSMRIDADRRSATFRPAPGSAPGGVEGEDRRTPIGRWLRRTSLDELPQLFNVLRGEMSLVGPRPERPEFVDLFQQEIERYGERHRVKSGITGWAQVNGLRGQTSIADRAEWDNYYIENWSMKLDLQILAMTVLTVFRRSEDE